MSLNVDKIEYVLEEDMMYTCIYFKYQTVYELAETWSNVCWKWNPKHRQIALSNQLCSFTDNAHGDDITYCNMRSNIYIHVTHGQNN